MRTADFDYRLPRGLVAQLPRPRGTTRLMVLDRRNGDLRHRRVAEIAWLLSAGDLLVLNDTRVIPARLCARRPTGRRFELLLLRPLDCERWEGLLRPSARARAGEELMLADGGRLIPEEVVGEGMWIVRCIPALGLDRLEELGEPPLPPYIERPCGATRDDRSAYQTVYASRPGAVAAPTAGLHLTPELFEQLTARGVRVTTITLHVGLGTFRPVTVDDISQHRMHREWYRISPTAAQDVNVALSAGRRIVCVGTTTVRALESGLAEGEGRLRSGDGWSRLFITPGYNFLGVGALMTNFHLPRSTLLMMVSALAGRQRILEAYRNAVEHRYRFFSYGDAMLIL